MTTPAPRPDGELAGLRFAPDPSVEVRSGGRVIVGGSPLRIMRLTAPGAEVARQALDGEPVPTGRAASALVRRLLDGGLVHPVAADGPHSPADVTVVIPVRGELPADVLVGLGPVAAVVVVDDASPVPVTAPTTTSAGVAVRVIRRAVQGGPAAARNTGLAAVDTALVAFVDADCVPVGSWLPVLLPHFADPAVAVVAPRIVPLDRGAATDVLARYEASRSALDLGDRPARVRARSRVSFVPSAALVARVGDLAAVGGFDESLAVGEDVDLVWRLDEGGRVVRYEPAATVAHRHRSTARAWARRRFDYGTSAGPLAIRHPGALVPVEASVWSVVAWGLGLAGHPWLGAGVAGGTAVGLARTLGEVDDAPALAAKVAAQGHLAVRAAAGPGRRAAVVAGGPAGRGGDPVTPAAAGPAARRARPPDRRLGHRAPLTRPGELGRAAPGRRHRVQRRRVGRGGPGPDDRAPDPRAHPLAPPQPLLGLAGPPAPDPGHPADGSGRSERAVASSMSSRTRWGGRCCSPTRTPRWARASSTAPVTAAGAPMAPPSPTPR